MCFELWDFFFFLDFSIEPFQAINTTTSLIKTKRENKKKFFILFILFFFLLFLLVLKEETLIQLRHFSWDVKENKFDEIRKVEIDMFWSRCRFSRKKKMKTFLLKRMFQSNLNWLWNFEQKKRLYSMQCQWHSNSTKISSHEHVHIHTLSYYTNFSFFSLFFLCFFFST